MVAAPFQTETTVGSDQGLPSHIGTHTAITQDKMRQDCKDGLTRRTLNAPDGETAEANAGIMGVTSQRATAVTGRFVVELQAQREDEGQDKLNECFAICEQVEVGGFIVEVDGEGAVLAFGFGGLCHVSSPYRRWWVRMRHSERNESIYQGD
jgi:hypothetical protein